jgi:hypothetical protein
MCHSVMWFKMMNNYFTVTHMIVHGKWNNGVPFTKEVKFNPIVVNPGDTLNINYKLNFDMPATKETKVIFEMESL